jgi:trimethylamine--corrinoid protein Co-methyltransferase
MQKGYKRRFAALKILQESQVEEIHSATLQLLQDTGFLFESQRALKLLADHGCAVDGETMVAKIPPDVVEWAVRQTPSSFVVKARDPDKSVMFGGNTLYFFNSAGARHTDVDTGTTSVATLEQNNRAVLVSDALESVNAFPSYTPYFEIEGVAPVMTCPVSCAQRMRFSSKPSRGATEAGSYLWEIQIAQACGCQLLGCMSIHPPLKLSAEGCDAAFHYVEAGFPMYLAAGSPMGAGHPVTLAGATVYHNAENLAMLVLVQCIKAGTGVIVDNFVSGMDMRSGDLNFGSAGCALHHMAFNQIWHHLYRIPINNVGSAFSNSKMVDYQLGAEKLPIAMCSALSGASMITLHGGVTAELAYSPILAVIDDDIARNIGRIVEGFEVNDETIGLDVIKEVGFGGSFLVSGQTRKFWRSEDYMPAVFDKSSYQEWASAGRKTVVEKAKARYAQILERHSPAPLSVAQDGEIDRILREAEGYYRKKGLM